jgi:predicted flap endonuclease-1-like 5' DNA nuclease
VPYTLAKFFLWGLLLALIGGGIGWMLRSMMCRGEVAQARRATVDQDELDRLRGRLANLEPAVAERDRLRMELADVRGNSAGALGFSASSETSILPDESAQPSNDAAAEQGTAPAGGADPLIAGFASVGDIANGDNASADDAASSAGDDAVADSSESESESVLDLAAAAAALGRKVKLDDLTVVEGIGPKIGELCNGIGVTTWRQLSHTDVAVLQSMLNDAGSRFQMHQPGSWPRQAGMLANGQWAEFKTLTDELDGGV